MQTFIDGIAVARKYQLPNEEMIQPSQTGKNSFGSVNDESYVSSQQTPDSFLSDSKATLRMNLNYYNNL